MPDMTAHYLHALRVLERLRTAPGFCPAAFSERAFVLGAQGPDPLYYDRSSRSRAHTLVPLAERLHQCPAEEQLSCIRDAGGAADAAVFTGYAAGFYCHRILDDAIVPFLRAAVQAHAQAFSEEGQGEDSLRLARVRTVQDIILLRRETGLLPMEFSLPAVFPKDRALWQTLAAGLEGALGGKGASREVIERAFADMYRCMRRLNDRTGYKITLLRFLSKGSKKLRRDVAHMRPMTEPDGFDYVNEENGVWLDAQGNERTESLFELFDDACVRAGDALSEQLCLNG